MNVLSLFDGMSCGQIALNRAGIKYDNYFASEIDRYAINVTMQNYPDTLQLGNVLKLSKDTFCQPIDLLIGGSPCQGFSMAGKQLNFEDERSMLFFEYVRLLRELRPRYFLLENVKMRQDWQDIISEYLEVNPVFIDSGDFVACRRPRLYWTNIPIKKWTTKGLVIADVLTCRHLRDITDRYNKKIPGTLTYKKSRQNTVSLLDKHRCITTGGQGISNSGATNIKIGDRIFCINPQGTEIMQSVPLDYTSSVSDTQRYKMLGNGWTVDVISHIFSGLSPFIRETK